MTSHDGRAATRSLRRSASRAIADHRRLLVAGLAAAAAAAAVSAAAPAPPRVVTVLAAARDLAAGAALASDDLVGLALPAGAVPDGALRPGADVLGRLVSSPVRRGEPLTDVRLVGPSLLAGLRGDGGPDVGALVAAPVRIADAESVRLVRAGDRVDVLAAPAGLGGDDVAATARDGQAQAIARNVLVVTVPTPSSDTGEAGALLVVATTPDVAARLARAAATSRLSITLRA
ncbi:MAG: SAF domain-containing protein [Frankia sp.]|nr:SAF domain-containing protein [Frankia sp.]